MPVPFKTSEDQNKHRDPMREVFTTLAKSHTWYLDTFLKERSHPVFPRFESGVPFDKALKAIRKFITEAVEKQYYHDTRMPLHNPDPSLSTWITQFEMIQSYCIYFWFVKGKAYRFYQRDLTAAERNAYHRDPLDPLIGTMVPALHYAFPAEDRK
ncbi:hypothetical protein SISSUDRAFT_1067863 [Sistotremastrum suecicum HHB10207 ss-3]|uniref:Uncharacterized protein n=1 Tax=Sistotremastrum suecicum HHB10207 ss-3 TaxID=1314776 RepID=A0A165WM35_9AGAM|nr:hypothetical protein SISSUDRAFT_1067863 [Sistotremastrum suecicum HHB10207 ss-3]